MILVNVAYPRFKIQDSRFKGPTHCMGRLPSHCWFILRIHERMQDLYIGPKVGGGVQMSNSTTNKLVKMCPDQPKNFFCHCVDLYRPYICSVHKELDRI